MKAAIDNDILFKGACYGLLTDLVSIVCPAEEAVGVLGSARFVVPNKIERSTLKQKPASVLEALFEFLSRATVLEPVTREQEMAADLELTAQRLGLSLDTGESQLCAILVHRFLSLLFTGDKRAIAAIERLLDVDPRLIPICGKVMCLEQAFASALARDGSVLLRCAVCAEPDIDKALTICFSCHSESVTVQSHTEGLQSYINALRAVATRVLAP
jgi:hypothetical protein